MASEIRGLIFDIDGTLLDSNDAHALCLQLALAHEGYAVEYSRIRKMIGMGLDHILPEVAGIKADSPKGKAIASDKDQCFEKKFKNVRPFAQAKDLISTLHQLKFKITIASSASKKDLKQFLKKLEIEPYLEEAASADDIEQSKPNPDIVEEALSQLGLKAEEVLMVGDTPYDIEAAKRAGVRTIAFRTGGWSDQDLREARMIFDGPADLLHQLAGGKLPEA